MACNPIETAPKNEEFIILQDESADGHEVARWSVEKGNWVREEGEPIRLTPTHWMQLPNASLVQSSSNLRGRDEEKALPLRRFRLYAAVFVTAGLAVLFPAFIGDFEPPSDALVRDLASARAEIEALTARAAATNSARNEPAQSVQTDRTRAIAPPLRATKDQIALWVKRGKDFIAVGDFVSARVVVQRAAEIGDVQAAFMLAATYDPNVLDRFRTKGFAADIAKARLWYEKARDLGSPEAPLRLELLAGRAAR